MSALLALYIDSRFLSPYALSAYVALQEKALPCELHMVDLAGGAQHAPGYAARSLTGRVPTLVHGDFSLSESSAIAEYLDEEFPAPDHAPLYPRDRRDRARARQVQAWLRSDFLPLRQERPTDVIFRRPSETPLSEAARDAAGRLFAAAGALLGGRAHLFGAWCIADTDLAIMLQRLVANGDDVPPALATYARAQWQRPSVQRWLGQARAR
jgi:glutathione S-transferase